MEPLIHGWFANSFLSNETSRAAPLLSGASIQSWRLQQELLQPPKDWKLHTAG